MVYGAAKAAGGTVLIESELGQGTSVRMLFPHSEEAASTVLEPSTEPPPPGNPKTLLVVEDEDAVREVLERILTAHGHRVLAASHPDQALAILGEGPPVDVLLTDVVMPGMSGPRLASRLTELQPGLPVVFISGYTERPDELPPGATVLRKPFTRAALLRKVAEAAVPA
jgi:CheY-like chemotaxis protein